MRHTTQLVVIGVSWAVVAGCIEPLPAECTDNSHCGPASASCMQAVCIERSCAEVPADDGVACAVEDGTDFPIDAIALPPEVGPTCQVDGAGACSGGMCRSTPPPVADDLAGDWAWIGSSLRNNNTPAGRITLGNDGYGSAYDQGSSSVEVSWCAASRTDVELSIGQLPLQGSVAHSRSAMLLAADPLSLVMRGDASVGAEQIHGDYSVLYLRSGGLNVETLYGTVTLNEGMGEMQMRANTVAPATDVQLSFFNGAAGVEAEVWGGDDAVHLWSASVTQNADVIIARADTSGDGVFVLVRQADTPPNMRGRWAMGLHTYGPGQAVSGSWFGDISFTSNGASGVLSGKTELPLTTLVTSRFLPGVYPGSILSDDRGGIYLLAVDPSGMVAIGQKVIANASGDWASFGRAQSSVIFAVRVAGE